MRGRDQQLAVVGLAAVPGEVVEEVGEVGAEVGIGGEQPDVFVEVRGLRVVVAGADVAVAPDAVGFLAHDEQHLGVGLQPDEAVDHVHARLFEDAGPFDVGLFVEARLELDERDDLLALLRGLHQRAHDRALLARGAVDGLLDREHVRIVGRLLDELLDRRRERVVRVVHEHVAGLQHAEEVARALGAAEHRLGLRAPTRRP